MIPLIYGIYVLLSAALLALIYRKSVRDWMLRFVLVSVLPVVGWLFPVFLPGHMFKNRGEKLDEYITKLHEDLTLGHLGIHRKIEVEKELNVVSIEDALIVSEHFERRRVMIDLLKQDSVNYLEVLQTAVSNDDTETSHYAVSAIMEAKRKLSLSIQELSVRYEQNKTDEYLLRTYAEVLKGFMRSGFLDERTMRKYMFTYIEVLEHLIANADHVEFAFKEKISTELKLGQYTDAEVSCLSYIDKYPHSETAYLSLMELYFTTKSVSKLQETVTLLKGSSVRLTNQGLTMVRYWSEGA
ncbi:hypothetical protein [Paenibacillus harenae]|uniref:hypothetical protein n=1 Tax=Paenibacillus harenae TaxID=306543 RepID=UPI0003FC00C4|nr:hypothetical protein [Paenibacillus harenae]